MRPARIAIPAPTPGDFRQPRGTKPQPKPGPSLIPDRRGENIDGQFWIAAAAGIFLTAAAMMIIIVGTLKDLGWLP